IEDIQQQIHENSPLSYARGLAGIGCGREYLSQHHFIQTETDDILEELDGIIFRSVIYKEFTDTSLHTGICGLGRYLLFRLSNSGTDPDKIKTLSNTMLLIHVIEKLERLLSESKRLTPDTQLLLAQIDKLHIYPSKVKTLLLKYKTEEPDINEERKDTMIPFPHSEYLFSTENSSLGIHNGYAAIGLGIIEQINSQHKTWRELI
ncbi:MAG: hypothetical protein LIO93_00460, partial [Bacteroidales bacterium]|nr:hypothetical protein [Bacteroidales bacterium]